MVSACVNKIGISSESFIKCPPAKYASYSWLNPKISSNREFPDSNALKSVEKDLEAINRVSSGSDEDKESDPEAAGNEFGEFEFQLEGDHVRMLSADELFSDGKLVPLQLSVMRPELTSENADGQVAQEISLRNEKSINDPYLLSPRAPTCSSRWKELFGLKKFYQNSNKLHEHQKATPPNTTNKSLEVYLHRSTKSSVSPQADSSLSLPLIHEADSESISMFSSRLSLTSTCSSSCHEHDDFPRLSLDSEKLNFRRSSNFSHRSRQLQGVSKERSLLASENLESIRTGRSSLRKDPELIVHDVDSPRMNSSGKIVFHSLERSSSSPSSLSGGPRYKYRGMERSYSANVRYTPVLNVPVCSLRASSSKSAGVFGFPLFSPSQHKKEGSGSVVSSTVASGGVEIKGLHINRKNRSDRA